MAGRKGNTPVALGIVQPPKVANSQTQRTLEALAQAVKGLQVRRTYDPPTVIGAKGGNSALESLIDALNTLGLIIDETT